MHNQHTRNIPDNIVNIRPPLKSLTKHQGPGRWKFLIFWNNERTDWHGAFETCTAVCCAFPKVIEMSEIRLIFRLCLPAWKAFDLVENIRLSAMILKRIYTYTSPAQYDMNISCVQLASRILLKVCVQCQSRESQYCIKLHRLYIIWFVTSRHWLK